MQYSYYLSNPLNSHSQFLTPKLINSDLLNEAINIDNGFHAYILGGGQYTSSDIPSSDYRYSFATILKRNAISICVILWPPNVDAVAKINTLNDANYWGGWKSL